MMEKYDVPFEFELGNKNTSLISGYYFPKEFRRSDGKIQLGCIMVDQDQSYHLHGSEYASILKRLDAIEKTLEKQKTMHNRECDVISDAFDRIFDLSRLQTNWDSYNGKPVSPDIIRYSIKFVRNALSAMTANNFMPASPFVAPTCNGGLQFEWNGKNGDIEIEITEPARFSILVSKNDSEPSEFAGGEIEAIDNLLKIL